MVERPPATDDDDTRPVLSHTAKLIIGAVVFALGILAGLTLFEKVQLDQLLNGRALQILDDPSESIQLAVGHV